MTRCAHILALAIASAVALDQPAEAQTDGTRTQDAAVSGLDRALARHLELRRGYEAAGTLGGRPVENAARSRGCRPGTLDRSIRAAMDASLLLVSRYTAEAGGFSVFGTGTVLDNGPGIDPLITAAHVAAPVHVAPDGREGVLAEILAFDRTGSLAARLEPLAYGDAGIATRAFREMDASNDVALLSVREFGPGESPTRWSGRALSLAPDRPTRVLAISSLDAPVTSRGASGGAVLDARNRIVGVIGQLRTYADLARESLDGPMPEQAISANGLAADERHTMEQLSRHKPDPVYAGISVAAPAAHPALLRALGQDSSDFGNTDSATVSTGSVFAYPQAECRFSPVAITGIPDMPAPGAYSDQAQARGVSPRG